ncbi:MAG: hypothetical protein PHC34_08960 [Candidatus Gastranaerophilales bacterium]|nr:hypothetical protein [Candidatus Gastranaerophilales bacterium]
MEQNYKRWYDEDKVVQKCVTVLENIHGSLKRQTATFLMQEIINKPPYKDMLSDDVVDLATSETQRRRWYDFDEVTRIFFELLRHSPVERRKEIAILALTFIEDLSEKDNESIEIKIPEEEKYLNIEIPE